MTVMTRKSEKLLGHLVAFAGSAQLVQQVLTELNTNATEPPTLEAVARRIAEIRNAQEKSHEQDAATPTVEGPSTPRR